jgi:hypothetical protein
VARNVRIIGVYSVESFIFPLNVFSRGADTFGRRIVNRAREIEARAIISLGTDPDVYGLRIESEATNWSKGRVIDISLPEYCPLVTDFESWDIAKIMSELNYYGLAHETNISGKIDTFHNNALMFRTLQAREKVWCTIPYIFLYLPYTAMAVESMPNFSKDKYLTSLPEIAKILAIIMDGLKAG